MFLLSTLSNLEIFMEQDYSKRKSGKMLQQKQLSIFATSLVHIIITLRCSFPSYWSHCTQSFWMVNSVAIYWSHYTELEGNSVAILKHCSSLFYY